MRVAMWSGPRNISTAMMRAFENRSDCTVSDEPLYAAFLKQTGLDHPGAAEVIADGHIHVYAPLRGKAIAGARGNTEARILSLCLEPELISIAGVYRTSEMPLPADVHALPTQVRLVGGAEGKLVMEPLHGNQATASGRARG